MKFFNWVQKKFNAGQENQSAKKKLEPSKEDDDDQLMINNDYPHGYLMLSIGTFGNKQEMMVDQPDDHFSEFTVEEIVKLEKELTKLLRRKTDDSDDDHHKPIIASHHDHLPLDKFLNSPSSLATSDGSFSTYSDDKDEEDEIDRTVRIILGRCKDLSENNNKKKKKNKTIGKKSLSFIVKKMFVCTGGFAQSAPGFRDAFQESRMEKLLRTMLTKTIFPRNSSGASSTKKCLEDCITRRTGNAENEDESHEESRDGSKWIKTDSEFIVLDL